jgi:hypothetical protein
MSEESLNAFVSWRTLVFAPAGAANVCIECYCTGSATVRGSRRIADGRDAERTKAAAIEFAAARARSNEPAEKI